MLTNGCYGEGTPKVMWSQWCYLASYKVAHHNVDLRLYTLYVEIATPNSFTVIGGATASEIKLWFFFGMEVNKRVTWMIFFVFLFVVVRDTKMASFSFPRLHYVIFYQMMVINKLPIWQRATSIFLQWFHFHFLETTIFIYHDVDSRNALYNATQCTLLVIWF